MRFSKFTSLALLAQLASCAPIVHIVTKTVETTVIVTVGQTQALGSAPAIIPVTLESTTSSTPTAAVVTATSTSIPANVNVVTISLDATGGAHTLYPTTSSSSSSSSSTSSTSTTPVPTIVAATTESTSAAAAETYVYTPETTSTTPVADTTSSVENAATTAAAPGTTVAATSTTEPTTTSTTSSSSAAAATTSSSSDLSSFASAILAEHNKYRALHGVSDLTWDDTLASYAENYANNYDCSGTLTHSGGPYGENLALGYTETGSVDAWYSEGDSYDYSSASVLDHFTQVVWKSTTKVGCAVKYCSSYWGSYIVCEYDPAGNIVGEASENVLPLSS